MENNHVIHTQIQPSFSDSRGDIYDIVEEPVSHVGMVTFTKGAVRGNHYHLKSVQYSYILDGEIEITTSAIDGSDKQVQVLKKGMHSVIPPNTIHTYKALTDASMLDMTTLNRKDDGYEKDTVRVQA